MPQITYVLTTEEPDREWTLSIDYTHHRGYPGRGPEAWAGPEPSEPASIEYEWSVVECLDYSLSKDQALVVKFSHPEIDAAKVVEAFLAPFVERHDSDIIEKCFEDHGGAEEFALEQYYEWLGGR